MEQAKTAADTMKDRVIAAIKTCYDPEIPVDIYELGLIYEIDVADLEMQGRIRFYEESAFIMNE